MKSQNKAAWFRVGRAARVSARLIVLAGMIVSSQARIAAGQPIGFAGEDPLKYGAMYRTYERLYGEALHDLDVEVRKLRSQGKNDAELSAAYERFRERSVKLDRQYRQPVIEKMFDAANLRTSEFVTRPVDGSSTGVRIPSPSDPITASKGTRPGEPGYRPWGADTDAQAGTRAVDYLPDVARDMGLEEQAANRLFAREPGYTTTDNNVLETTVHKSGRLDRIGSAAWAAQIEVDATRAETALHVDMKPGPMQDYVAVRDHESKARKGLDVPARNLMPGAEEGTNMAAAIKLQGLVKGTLKSVETAALPDETLTRLMRESGIEGNSAAKLRNVLQSLKGGAAIVPESVGLNDGNIDRFQSLCRALIDESRRVTRERADAAMQEKLAVRDGLEASKDPADRERAREIRREILDARKRMEESDRGDTRRVIDDLTKTIDAATVPDKDSVPGKGREPEAEARRRRMDADREVTSRRNRQAVRDLFADVERRKVVDGESVVQDLQRAGRGAPPAQRGHAAPPEIPPSERGGLLTHPTISRGLTIGGGLLATYEALKEEYYEAERRLKERNKGATPTRSEVLKELSIGRAGARTFLNLTGIEGAWMAGQNLKYEWVQGTNDSIDSELERWARVQRALGESEADISFGRSAQIAIKASIRQVTRATYQGAKGMPLIGDFVAAPETLFGLLESSFGVLYDLEKRDRILAANAANQAETSARFALQAEQLVGEMRGQVAMAQRRVEQFETLKRLSQQAETQVERIRELFRTDAQGLETLLAKAEGLETVSARLPGAAEIRQWGEEIAGVTREAAEIARVCDRLEAALNGGTIECATIREQDPELTRWRDAVALRGTLLQEKNLTLTALLGDLGPAAEARQLQLRLEAARRDAQQASQTLESASDIAKSIQAESGVWSERLGTRRMRVRELHGQYRAQATPGVQAEWDRILQEANGLELPPFSAREMQDATSRLSSASAHADLLARTETATLPVPLQPRRIDGQLSGDLDSVRKPLQEMERTLERAGEKLDGLHQLCPVRPQFMLAAEGDAEAGVAVRFRVTGSLPDAGAKTAFVWLFGDGTDAVKTSRGNLSHTFSRAGRYHVVVRIYEERPDFTAERGEATVSVEVRGPVEPQTPRRLPDQLALSVTPAVSLVGEVRNTGRDPFLEKFPLGTYFGTHGLRLTRVMGTDDIEADLDLGIDMKVHTFILMSRYTLRMKSRGRGKVDPKSGRFRIDLGQAQWEERLPDTYPPLGPVGVKGGPVPPEDRLAMQEVVRRALGGAPGEFSWTGHVSGTMDWESFQGGSGNLEINPVFRGTWEVAQPHPYWVEWPESVPRLGNGRAWLRIYPTEDVAHQQFLWRSRTGPMSGPQRRLTDMGNEGAVIPGRGVLIRSGRWDMEMSGSGIPNDLVRIREVFDAAGAYVEQQQLETRLVP